MEENEIILAPILEINDSPIIQKTEQRMYRYIDEMIPKLNQESIDILTILNDIVTMENE